MAHFAKVENGIVTDEIVYLDAFQETNVYIAQIDMLQNKELQKAVDSAVRQMQRENEQEIKQLRRELDDKIKKALDNPLANK